MLADMLGRDIWAGLLHDMLAVSWAGERAGGAGAVAC